MMEGEPQFDFRISNEANAMARRVARTLGDAVRGSGFHVVEGLMRRLAPGGSYHYAGTLPMTEATSTGEVAPGVYVTDSTQFVTIPAQNHTFSIMANAMRVVDESFGGAL